MQAKGFTFCVPSNWSGSGRRQQHGEASITWGTGQPPARTATRVVQMHGGDLLPSAPTGSVVHSSSESIGGGDVHSFSESIGGAAASLYENDLVQGFITGATWRSKSIYLQGEARDRGTAEIELTIYRTVRFAAP
ncbi:MAG TPA: hypothetical protein VF166_00635 [Gemmatimonadaceae bacterium]